MTDAEASARTRGRRGRIALRSGAALLGLGLAYAVLWRAPKRQLERARAEVERCHRYARDDIAILDDCRARPRVAASLRSPVTRRSALEFIARTDYARDRIALEHASRQGVDAAARDAAAARLLLDADALVDLGLDAGELAPDLVHAGALGAAADGLGPDAGRPTSHPELVARATLGRGQLERLRDLWRASPTAPTSWPAALERGAWLCLLDEVQLGEAALREAADALGQRGQDDANLDAIRVALAACTGAAIDPELGPLEGPGYRGWVAAREVARGDATAEAWLGRLDAGERSPVLAQAVARDPTTLEALAHGRELSPSPRLLQAGRGVITAHVPRTTGIVYDPGTMLRAAEATIAADGVSASSRALAGLIAAEAAVELIARGSSSEARAALALAGRHIDATDAWVLHGPRILVGDARAVLDEIHARLAQGDALPVGERERLAELELRALAASGDWQRALARAGRFRSDLEGRSDRHALAVATWYLALALQLHEPTPSGLPLATEAGDGWTPATLAWHLRLARDLEFAEAERPALSSFPVAPDCPDLGAVLLGQGAWQGDAEVWLDLAFVDQLSRLGREAIWARAEAARWRGDAGSEARWRGRLGELLALAKDEERAMLLHLAGI
ncbi:hypothetical protein G6O69_31550 [Pseudenhygromyxa sp. WMMC2535]|uniref:hypothetical protein n=1 Tax=Pseudenhygromyxa sp. WMMC2535 TaxID=2712867 RepID=UPI0015539886|nr:hypothetical protein [Pseudenhygromyxa sp. WMMC2535]NVB42401.1 hypothetical protein [Pseudenhygromyxa sp. WMMC2535]